jgi:putative membrane protein
MTDWLIAVYPWIKSLHVISVIAWMAGMFYLPRLFVYHAEQAPPGSEKDAMFQVMERRLMRGIINPAMIATWLFGLMMVWAGQIDWSEGWPWLKAAGVLAMSAFHGFLSSRRKAFAEGCNLLSGRTWRMLNELPPLLMVVIVVAVIARPF